MVKDRQEFISSLIGRPWEANAKGPEAFDCWHCAQYVKRNLFNDPIPNIEVPDNPTWKWMIQQFRDHPENREWQEQPQPPNGLLLALDGSLVLMARLTRPAHIGVLFMPEKMILHCDQEHGVVYQDMLTIRTNGWTKLRFYARAYADAA